MPLTRSSSDVVFGRFPTLTMPVIWAFAVKAAIQSLGEILVLARGRDREVGAAEEGRHRLARDVARHREGAHERLQLRVAGLRVERVAELPAGADERRRVALRERRGRERVRLVGRLARAGQGEERVLERVQALRSPAAGRACPSTCRSTASRSARRSRRRRRARSTSPCRRRRTPRTSCRRCWRPSASCRRRRTGRGSSACS